MEMKKVKTIAKAFLSDLPVEEVWYQERLSICNTCDKNTKNMSEEELSFVDKLKIKTGICVGEDNSHCTACGCCIFQKCATKTESCGMKEIGKTPKWNALEIEDVDGRLAFEALHNTGKISKNGSEVLFDFGTSSEKVLKASFVIKSERQISFSKYSVSCGCTHPSTIEQPTNKSIKSNVDISTLGFRVGLNEKTMTIEYIESKTNKLNKLTIRFRVIKL